MSKNTATHSGERLSFYKLFCEKQYRISIPIIQRDYAQGRQTTTEVRNIFLDALFSYLEENKPNRDLDFVYGSINEADGITDFIPLDGQQRLTTLFLLHWYLCQISENEIKKAEFKGFLVKDGKSMFTYETRSSSSEFCDAFMSNDIDFNNLLEADMNSDGSKDNRLSKTVENSSWFFLSWKNDPTIQSMLTMLDAISVKFCEKKEYFERLIDTENPIITFLFLNLKDFKLTDDLYIKMNSRGKPLTSFENFKAKFEQHLENVVTERKFKLIFGETEKEVSLKEYFSYNIDTKWANLFWAHREVSGDKHIYDEELKNFIRVILSNQYAITNEKDDRLEFLLGTQVARRKKDYTDNISYYKYKDLEAISETSVLYLIDAFDNLVNGNEKVKNHLSDSYRYYFNENAVFENALNHSFANNQERVLLHAYIRFLIENKSDRTGIEQWMRTIHNLAYNTIIDGADEISRVIKSIEKLLPYSNNIIEHLSKKPQIDSFWSLQALEERIKSCLIIKGDYWKEIIEKTEKYDCFDGQIGFVLEFSGIVDYYNINNNLYWTKQEDDTYFNSFSNYANKAVAVFNGKTKYNSDYIWERAVLTKGDYLTEASSCRKNLLTTERNARDFSWKRLLRITDESKGKRQFIKKVFDDTLFNENNIKGSLEKICKSRTRTWRDYLISCPALIRYCTQGFIRFINENDVILLGQSQMNHWHTEMYTFFLWKQHIESLKDNLKVFKDAYYCSTKSSDDNPHISLGCFCYARIYYEANINYCGNDKLSDSYEIELWKIKGENLPDKYGENIKNVCKKMGFEWNDEYKAYYLMCDEGNMLMERLKRLDEEISEL